MPGFREANAYPSAFQKSRNKQFRGEDFRDRYRVQYRVEDVKRGWAPCSWPPQDMTVGCVTSSWASRQGITVGDDLVEIDGMPVAGQYKADIIDALMQRPLVLTFAKNSNDADPKHLVHTSQQSTPFSRQQWKNQTAGTEPQTASRRFHDAGKSVTALHQAARRGNIFQARSIAERLPAQRSVRDPDGRLPLHWAAEGGYDDLLPLLAIDDDHFQLTSDDLSCDMVDDLGCSPLWLAAKEGHEDCCRWLLERGCDPLRRARDGTHAVWQAARGAPDGSADPPAVLALLLSPLIFVKGFNNSPKLSERFLLEDAIDSQGATLFHAAARENAVGVMHWIIEHTDLSTLAIVIRTRTNVGEGETALDVAKMNGCIEAADVLVELKASTKHMTTIEKVAALSQSNEWREVVDRRHWEAWQEW